MRGVEQALQFDCAGETLIGVLSAPPAAALRGVETAVLIIVGGPQYRLCTGVERARRMLVASRHGFAYLDLRCVSTLMVGVLSVGPNVTARAWPSQRRHERGTLFD